MRKHKKDRHKAASRIWTCDCGCSCLVMGFERIPNSSDADDTEEPDVVSKGDDSRASYADKLRYLEK